MPAQWPPSGRLPRRVSLDTLLTLHSWVRWLVLLGLVAGVGLGISRHLAGGGWEPGRFSAAVIALDVEVLIGIVLYLGNEGWDQGTFIAIVHPSLVLLALAVAHVGLGYAKRNAGGEPNKVVAYAFFVSVVLVVAAVPWDRL